MPSASTYFDKCEEELKQTLFSLRQKKGRSENLYVDNLLTSHDLSQVSELIEKYSALAQTLTVESRLKAEDRLKQYHVELINLRSKSYINRQPSIEDPQTLLLKGDQRLTDSNNRIVEAQKLAYESEEIGLNVLGDLRRQREQILKAQHTLQETDANVGHSNKVIKEIFTRMQVNQLILYALIFFLIMSILAVLYYKIFT